MVVLKTFALSQLCSNCGYRNKEFTNLKPRKWGCSFCRTHYHRNIHAQYQSNE
ncbi:hypothetical protein CN602_18675 [Bacillus cereus]|nr:hypothetical protein CN602_18675 [Bacillus cereus]